ncbi:MAG TPA: YdeI/OmpD-associated family protein [Chitinophagaceae bacterium]|nr:YdeI/OmpD-associated family protein [Chitinophagaceae bacterium]
MAETKVKTFYPPTRKAWRDWLEKNHASATEIWVVFYKQASGKPRVPYADAVEEALCYGWIDSTMRPVDEHKYMQRFTPRKPKSVWSALNKTRVEKLIAEGLMTPAGMKKIELAKQNGSWSSIDHVESLQIPDDLQKAFNKSKTAFKFFDTLSRSRKKMILYRINSAKLPETRKKRIAQMITMLREKKFDF